VRYSSVNYKDALSAAGNPGVTKVFPHIPGIDAVGEIIESCDMRWPVGQMVLAGGHGFGSSQWGGFGELASCNGDCLSPLPTGLMPREAAALGTAGLTAALSVMAIRHQGVTPDRGPIVVTGAGGGVGSISVAILAKLGYEVAAISGKPRAHYLLRELGAKHIYGRGALADKTTKPLLPARWAGVVDAVGGSTLASLLKSVMPGGCVACSGNVGGVELLTSVYPFILRGVSLVGIDSGGCSEAKRREAWEFLAGEMRVDKLSDLVHEISLGEVGSVLHAILASETIGRTLVRIAD
jgi:putative YhdH/YhfP family quinone oxidoreductase